MHVKKNICCRPVLAHHSDQNADFLVLTESLFEQISLTIAFWNRGALKVWNLSFDHAQTNLAGYVLRVSLSVAAECRSRIFEDRPATWRPRQGRVVRHSTLIYFDLWCRCILCCCLSGYLRLLKVKAIQTIWKILKSPDFDWSRRFEPVCARPSQPDHPQVQ